MKKERSITVWGFLLDDSNSSAVTNIRRKLITSKKIEKFTKQNARPSKGSSENDGKIKDVGGMKLQNKLKLSMGIFRWIGKAKAKIERFSSIQKEIRSILEEGEYISTPVTPSDLLDPFKDSSTIPKKSSNLEKLKSSYILQKTVGRWWRLVFKNEEDKFPLRHYIEMNAVIYLFLTPGIKLQNARELSQVDTESEFKGVTELEYEQFFDSLVELALSWCETKEEEECYEFLEALRKKMDHYLYPTGGGGMRGDPERVSIVEFQNMESRESGDKEKEFSSNVKRLVKKSSFLIQEMNVGMKEKKKVAASQKRSFAENRDRYRDLVERNVNLIDQQQQRIGEWKIVKDDDDVDNNNNNNNNEEDGLKRESVSDEDFFRTLFLENEPVDFDKLKKNEEEEEQDGEKEGYQFNEIVFEEKKNESPVRKTKKKKKKKKKMMKKKKKVMRRRRGGRARRRGRNIYDDDEVHENSDLLLDPDYQVLTISQVRRYRKKVHENNRRRENFALAKRLEKTRSQFKKIPTKSVEEIFPTLENVIRIQKINGGTVSLDGVSKSYDRFQHLERMYN